MRAANIEIAEPDTYNDDPWRTFSHNLAHAKPKHLSEPKMR